MAKIRSGAIGALLDEYERAISDLKKTMAGIPDHLLTVIADSHVPKSGLLKQSV
jgi:hypothetical protein